MSNEFIEQLLNLAPVNIEEDAMLKDWYEKSPLVKKRISALSAPAEVADDKAKDKAKKKK
jgi:hypothetical protein